MKTRTAATWQPGNPTSPGRLSTADKAALPDSAFAFPRARKEPLTDAAHVRDALARFDQVGEVTDAERNLAFANLQTAANHFGIKLTETDWHQFGTRSARPHHS